MCSLHFPGEKKSFAALPTVVKKRRQTVNSSQSRIHVINTNAKTSQSKQQTTAIDVQDSAIEKLKTEETVYTANTTSTCQ